VNHAQFPKGKARHMGANPELRDRNIQKAFIARIGQFVSVKAQK
jgi:hypothetical protein